MHVLLADGGSLFERRGMTEDFLLDAAKVDGVVLSLAYESDLVSLEVREPRALKTSLMRVLESGLRESCQG